METTTGIVNLTEKVTPSCIEESDSVSLIFLVLIGVCVIIATTCSAWAFFSFKCIVATKRVKLTKI